VKKSRSQNITKRTEKWSWKKEEKTKPTKHPSTTRKNGPKNSEKMSYDRKGQRLRDVNEEKRVFGKGRTRKKKNRRNSLKKRNRLNQCPIIFRQK